VTEFFSTEGLARYLGVPAATVKAWRYKGTGPRGLRVGKHIRYRRTDVERWLDSQADQGRQSTNRGYQRRRPATGSAWPIGSDSRTGVRSGATMAGKQRLRPAPRGQAERRVSIPERGGDASPPVCTRRATAGCDSP
jgi:excisionase family DNA binding protein